MYKNQSKIHKSPQRSMEIHRNPLSIDQNEEWLEGSALEQECRFKKHQRT